MWYLRYWLFNYGQRWLNDYLNNLCDEELAMVREGNSSATFTFGDGVRYESVKRIVLEV